MDPYLNSSKETDNLARKAIEAATSLNWTEAVKINQKIITSDKNNVEAINRLARAQLCLGELQIAQKLYKKVINLDPYNLIAHKNLEKISKASVDGINKNAFVFNSNGSGINLSNLFLTEPGKTKMINLINLAQPSILASINSGDELLINPKNHSVTLCTRDKVYLGALPDDLAHRLIAFIDGGNKYDAYVKSSTTKSITVFIRELERSTKFTNQPSFQSKQLTEEEA